MNDSSGKAMRIDKLLSEMGIATRSAAKDMAKSGRVTVNGEVIKKADVKVTMPGDTVCVDGEPIVYSEFEYYMMNKPTGVVSATEDKKHKTVIDLIEGSSRKGLFPVGRLDIDTEGLLLITNDGELSHKLLSPTKHVPKVYFARLDVEVTEEDVKTFAEGINIGTEEEPEMTRPAKLEMAGEGTEGTAGEGLGKEVFITIHEGKYHQIKRMFEAVGKKVQYLKRLSMGSLKLDEKLAPGEYRMLSDEEINGLKM